MKKNIISKLLLVMLAIVLTGCEKLPEVNRNRELSYYDDTDLVIYILPTSVKLRSSYYDVQMSDNAEFSGATMIDFTEQNGSYLTDRVINNLKPGTTYYYRRVSTDNLGGQIYGTSHSFTTKDEDFKFVESITPTWGNCWSYGDGSGHYELTFAIKLNEVFAIKLNEVITSDYGGLQYSFYIQTPEGNYNYEARSLYKSQEEYSISFTGKPSDEVAYWITISDSDENNTLLYTSEKKTIECPEFDY